MPLLRYIDRDILHIGEDCLVHCEGPSDTGALRERVWIAGKKDTKKPGSISDAEYTLDRLAELGYVAEVIQFDCECFGSAHLSP